MSTRKYLAEKLGHEPSEQEIKDFELHHGVLKEDFTMTALTDEALRRKFEDMGIASLTDECVKEAQAWRSAFAPEFTIGFSLRLDELHKQYLKAKVFGPGFPFNMSHEDRLILLIALTHGR